jgi:hypothetical protein
MLMIKIIIIIILLILIFLFNYYELFTIFNPVDQNTPNGYYDIDRYFKILFPSDKDTSSIYQNRFNFIPSTIDDDKLNKDISLSTSNYDDLKSNKCCLVKKELNGNNFKYTFKKYNDLECDIDKVNKEIEFEEKMRPFVYLIWIFALIGTFTVVLSIFNNYI